VDARPFNAYAGNCFEPGRGEKLTSEANARHYKPQLDALRAIAVIAVLESHFNSAGWGGHAGVRLFFVLSGYLITSILLSAREARQDTISSRRVMINFYARRALRIWPAYYAVILFMSLANFVGFRSVAWWNALFLTNVNFALTNQMEPWVTAAWWSLSVEEQFYLVWPCLLLFSRAALIKPIVIATIVCGVLWHLYFYGDYSLASAYLPPASMDALGAGALLAVMADDLERWRKAFLPVIGVSIVLTSWTHLAGVDLADLASLPGMMALVAGASIGFSGVIGRILESRILKEIGKISYGVYLFHNFVLAGLMKALPGISWLANYSWTRFAFAGSVTLIVASLSWHFLEKPANRLKRHFPM
jgi:peptidoglycan/LPS O-acetylase OafA/YrhL